VARATASATAWPEPGPADGDLGWNIAGRISVDPGNRTETRSMNNQLPIPTWLIVVVIILAALVHPLLALAAIVLMLIMWKNGG
jgi:hypothetical protein